MKGGTAVAQSEKDLEKNKTQVGEHKDREEAERQTEEVQCEQWWNKWEIVNGHRKRKLRLGSREGHI